MGPLTRKTPGWETRLQQAIEDAIWRPFQWGCHDCATWAFDVAAALTETESRSGLWLGRYHTSLGAERLKRRLGWATRREGGVQYGPVSGSTPRSVDGGFRSVALGECSRGRRG